MKKFIFILGGARCGKSSYAVKIAEQFHESVTFFATAIAFDEEMKERIQKHKSQRPKHWKVIEEPRDIAAKLTQEISSTGEGPIIIDCLGLLINNLLLDNMVHSNIEGRIRDLVFSIEKSKRPVIVVSNEVGCGIVPENALARGFRDLVGISNQIMAEKADVVIVMHSGIPITIKGEKDVKARLHIRQN